MTNGDRISFIVEGNTVRIVNSAVYAMQVLQSEMTGQIAWIHGQTAAVKAAG